jgi:glyoxylase-like metal-dependent hydrolase (beta-lactamase superfamily II)
MTLQVHTIVSLPFMENSYVVHLAGRPDALVIDPGLEPDLILDYLRDEGLTVAAILNTHGHADHIAGNAALKEAFPAVPLLIGARDSVMLADADANLSALFGLEVTSPPADRLLHEGDRVEAAGLAFEVFDVPGHSPGHVVFVHRGQPVRVFGGDVLLRGGVGRCDFPGGDGRQLFEGIRGKLFSLPDEAVVYPGHGPVTTIGQEKRSNPFVGMGQED